MATVAFEAFKETGMPETQAKAFSTAV